MINFFLCLLCIFICSPATVFAATYYVSPGGSDGNSGLDDAPFRTIQKAADFVRPGDTVIVKNGTYTDTDRNGTVVLIERGGTPSGRITFRSENKWGAVLDGQNNKTGLCIQIKAPAQYITIEDFEIKGCDSNGIQSPSFGTVNNIIIRGNNIHSMGRKCDKLSNGNSGIFMGHGTSHITIDSNVIHDNGRFWAGTNGCDKDNGHDNDHGVYSHATNVVITNNLFYNQDSGVDVNIKALKASGAGNKVKIMDNVFGATETTKNGRIYLTAKNRDGYRNEDIIIEGNTFNTGKSAYAIDVHPAKPAGSGQRNIAIRNNRITSGKLIRKIAPECQNQFKYSNNITRDNLMPVKLPHSVTSGKQEIN